MRLCPASVQLYKESPVLTVKSISLWEEKTKPYSAESFIKYEKQKEGKGGNENKVTKSFYGFRYYVGSLNGQKLHRDSSVAI